MKALRYLSIFIPLLFATNHASADDSSEWQFTVVPYLWMAGQQGDVATLPPAGDIELDLSFSDILSNMDMALMGFFEARKGRVSLFTEVFYVGTSADAEIPAPYYSKAEYEQDLWAVTVGGAYTMLTSNRYQLEVVSGLRFWDLDNSLKLSAGTLAARKVSANESWQDLLLGIRARAMLNDKWRVNGWIIPAVAGDSDSAWDLYAGASYQYSEALSFNGGYRHQTVDYEEDSFLYDIEMSGPTLGLAYQF